MIQPLTVEGVRRALTSPAAAVRTASQSSIAVGIATATLDTEGRRSSRLHLGRTGARPDGVHLAQEVTALDAASRIGNLHNRQRHTPKTKHDNTPNLDLKRRCHSDCISVAIATAQLTRSVTTVISLYLEFLRKRNHLIYMRFAMAVFHFNMHLTIWHFHSKLIFIVWQHLTLLS